MSKQAKVLSDKDVKKVLLHISAQRYSVRNRAMFMCMYLAGLRVAECAALTYQHVISSDGELVDQFTLRPHETKGKHSRTVFVGERCKRELRAYLRYHPLKQPDAPLFASQKSGKAFTPNTLCQLFHHLFKESGLTDASSHSPRRTFITNLANRGVGVRVLQHLAGHRSISTTQRYIDVNDGQQRAAVNLL